MFTINFLYPQKFQLISTLTKHAMLLFFFVLREQQGYRDKPLRRVVSAILKNTRQEQSSLRSFPIVCGHFRRFSHVISGRFLIGK